MIFFRTRKIMFVLASQNELTELKRILIE